MSEICQISPSTLKNRLDADERFVLVDVRERDEWYYCRIERAVNKPLSEIARWIGDLDPDEEYVFFCHHGMRSYQACVRAAAHEITNVANLIGGIDAWSETVDPNVPRY